MTGDEARAIYRTEKAKRAERAQAALTPVKKAFRALLDREKEQRKGGRPRKNFTLGSRPFHAVRVDPADALLVALGRFTGRAG